MANDPASSSTADPAGGSIEKGSNNDENNIGLKNSITATLDLVFKDPDEAAIIDLFYRTAEGKT